MNNYIRMAVDFLIIFKFWFCFPILGDLCCIIRVGSMNSSYICVGFSRDKHHTIKYWVEVKVFLSSIARVLC